jgi:hypothetical protein
MLKLLEMHDHLNNSDTLFSGLIHFPVQTIGCPWLENLNHSASSLQPKCRGMLKNKIESLGRY